VVKQSQFECNHHSRPHFDSDVDVLEKELPAGEIAKGNNPAESCFIIVFVKVRFHRPKVEVDGTRHPNSHFERGLDLIIVVVEVF
jgi:hypothetical protein